MLTELSASLFSILLLPSLHNKVYTLFLYFSFLRSGFCKFLIIFLDEQISFLRLVLFTVALASSHSKFSTFSSFSIRFCSCRFSLVLCGFSSAIRLLLIHSNTVKSCFQAYVFFFPKNIIFLFEKKEL